MLNSKQIYEESLGVIPGGVNSPVRAFKNVGLTPLVVERGEGAYIFDVDKNRYLDYCGSWGALIHGHAHPKIVKGVQERVAKGTTFGMMTNEETLLAKKICTLIPSIEKIRFVSSGTEATMSAIRVARAFTKKEKIVKFEGHYHGHADHLLVKGGSGLIESVVSATSKGVPLDVIKNTITLPFNEIEIVEQILHNEEIAAFILEPIAANMGVVLPKEGFLSEVARICKKKGILLIFDEVITGFRVALQGAQKLFNITPDLTCFGKIIGGGFPAAAFGGRREIMDLLAPLGEVYQAGTLSGNPVAMEAGLIALTLLEESHIYNKLQEKADLLLKPIEEMIQKKALPVTLNRIGTMFTLFFGAKEVTHFRHFDLSLYATLFQYLLKNGIYFSPSQYEANFISLSHSDDDLLYTREKILKGIELVF